MLKSLAFGKLKGSPFAHHSPQILTVAPPGQWLPFLKHLLQLVERDPRHQDRELHRLRPAPCASSPKNWGPQGRKAWSPNCFGNSSAKSTDRPTPISAPNVASGSYPADACPSSLQRRHPGWHCQRGRRDDRGQFSLISGKPPGLGPGSFHPQGRARLGGCASLREIPREYPAPWCCLRQQRIPHRHQPNLQPDLDVTPSGSPDTFLPEKRPMIYLSSRSTGGPLLC